MPQSTLSTQSLTLVLATTIPVGLLASILVVVWCRARRRKARLFRRGITPIDDEEIESWKVDREDEKKSSSERPRPSHHTNRSGGSISKPAGVIVYTPSQYNRRVSQEHVALSTSPQHKRSFDMSPTSIQARAPNARPGLTDDAVQGDAAYLAQVKRQPSRLAKQPPVSGRHNRAWSTRTISHGGDMHDQWYGADLPPRRSTDTFTRTQSVQNHPSSRNGHYSSPPNNPARSSLDEELLPGGLSPRPPVHKSEIGRAIG